MGDQSFRVTPVASPTRQQVADALRRAILTGALKPGERLLERELLDLVGASRSSLREALRQIEAEGLLTLSTKGLHVAQASDAEMEQWDEVLHVLEGLLEARVRKRADRAVLARVRTLGRQCRHLLRVEGEVAARETGSALWFSLLAAAESEPLASSLTAIERRLAVQRCSPTARRHRLSSLLALAARATGEDAFEQGTEERSRP